MGIDTGYPWDKIPECGIEVFATVYTGTKPVFFVTFAALLNRLTCYVCWWHFGQIRKFGGCWSPSNCTYMWPQSRVVLNIQCLSRIPGWMGCGAIKRISCNGFVLMTLCTWPTYTTGKNLEFFYGSDYFLCLWEWRVFLYMKYILKSRY